MYVNTSARNNITYAMPWSIVDPLLVGGTAGPSACACTAGNSAPIKQTNKTANCIIVLVISTSFPQTRVHCFAQEGASVTIPPSLLPLLCRLSFTRNQKHAFNIRRPAMKTCHSYGSRSQKQEKNPHKERGGLNSFIKKTP
jgi:hypothetical protein